jgi:hypothetical protein
MVPIDVKGMNTETSDIGLRVIESVIVPCIRPRLFWAMAGGKKKNKSTIGAGNSVLAKH